VNGPDAADVVPLAVVLLATVPLVALLAAVVPRTAVPLVDAVLAAVAETAEPVVAGRVATDAPLVPLAVVAAVVADVDGALVAVELEPPQAARIAAAALAATPPMNPRRESRGDRILLSLIAFSSQLHRSHAPLRAISETAPGDGAPSLSFHDSTVKGERHEEHNNEYTGR
jgi:hypothetical protein